MYDECQTLHNGNLEMMDVFSLGLFYFGILLNFWCDPVGFLWIQGVLFRVAFILSRYSLVLLIKGNGDMI